MTHNLSDVRAAKELIAKRLLELEHARNKLESVLAHLHRQEVEVRLGFVGAHSTEQSQMCTQESPAA
jgi:hypothetical protein